MVDALLRNFGDSGRLRLKLPVAPHSDLLEHMTGKQMDSFREALQTLSQALQRALAAATAEAAQDALEVVFGRGFANSA